METIHATVPLHDTHRERLQSIVSFLQIVERDLCGQPCSAGWNSAAVLAWAAVAELMQADEQGTFGGSSAAGGQAATDDLNQLLGQVRAAAQRLQPLGLVLRVEQRPLKPLRQGHYQTVVFAVPGRGVVA